MLLLPIAWIAAPARGQQFGIGASYGWFNDVEHGWHLEGFRSPNWEAWLESHLGEDVLLRATYGTMRVLGDNVGETFVVDGTPIVMPEYRDQIHYVTLSVSYLFWEGPLTSGLFAGVGGYGIRPDSVSTELDPYRDNRERVFGLHAGVDGSLHVYRGLAVVGRLAFHGVFSQTRRSLLVASAGAVYRF
ncbi:MAG: hypothetical protein ACRD3M_07225 [Thermoanaerobaculia bacterium]